jgi:3-deoxy-7-phosphoheptulonate synthase
VDNIDDLRIRGIRPLVPSACLIDDVTGEPEVYETVGAARLALSRAVRGEDSRLVVVAGPVSAHDPAAALEYANKLKALQTKLKDELIVVMRVFLDEPTGGAGYWSGSMYDPDMDGSFQINKGFRQARQLLLDINRLGLPVGCLYLDTISPQFIADLVSWSCISGRSVQSELHRELASGLSTPVGFQAVGEGALAAELAVDAVRASGAPHAFLSVSKQGVAGIVETTGNKDCHVVLQAGDADALKTACAALEKVDKAPRCMLDCPDAASAHKVASLVSGGGRQAFGVLLPSFLKGGAQVLRPGGAGLTYGQSVTAPCMDWAATEAAIEHLASAIRQRRAASAPSPMGRAPSAQDLRGFDEGSKIESTDNLRVRRIRPLLPPGVCIEEADADAVVKASVFETRCEVSAIMHAEDDRLVVVVGPEAIHDRNATMEYAARLKGVAEGLKEELLVIMQVNFESATASSLDGWKGLINDPDLDGSYHINKGFRQARQLLLDINRLGLPCGCEYLDTITPQYLADLVSWAFVGERTCASRAHRELASGLSTPVGFFKDSVRDAIRNKEMVALDAVRASGAPHAFLSVSKQGVAGIVETTGNKDCHVVLPPNEVGTKLPAESAALAAAELPTKVMVHCKVGAGEARAQTAQMAAVQDVAELVAGGSDSVLGVLLPSFLLGGKQPLRSTSGDAASSRIYGMSVTEPCLDWTSTADALERLAASVRQRRAAASAKKPRTK